MSIHVQMIVLCVQILKSGGFVSRYQNCRYINYSYFYHCLNSVHLNFWQFRVGSRGISVAAAYYYY